MENAKQRNQDKEEASFPCLRNRVMIWCVSVSSVFSYLAFGGLKPLLPFLRRMATIVGFASKDLDILLYFLILQVYYVNLIKD